MLIIPMHSGGSGGGGSWRTYIGLALGMILGATFIAGTIHFLGIPISIFFETWYGIPLQVSILSFYLGFSVWCALAAEKFIK